MWKPFSLQCKLSSSLPRDVLLVNRKLYFVQIIPCTDEYQPVHGANAGEHLIVIGSINQLPIKPAGNTAQELISSQMDPLLSPVA